MAGVDPVQVAGVSENNLQRIQDVIGTSLVRRSGVDQTPAPSNEVAQVFPTYGSIFFPTYGSTVLPPYRIAKYRTDHIIIGSFDPNSFLKLQGGGAGWFHKYIDGPLASMATNTRVISDDESRTFVGILNKLDAQKKLNNGQPLARISLMSHGSSAGVSLGNNQIYNVRQIVAGIMDTNLLKPGGRLVLGGCSIADTPEACAELSKVAKRFKIIIQASEIDTVGGSGNLAHKTFFPDGKVTRNVGPFAPF